MNVLTSEAAIYGDCDEAEDGMKHKESRIKSRGLRDEEYIIALYPQVLHKGTSFPNRMLIYCPLQVLV